MQRNKNDIYSPPDNIIPHDAPILKEHYAHILAAFPQARICRSPEGTIRFIQNNLMNLLGCPWSVGTEHEKKYPGALTLNDIAILYSKGKFSIEEYMLFYQGLGYSLSGFMDVFDEEVYDMIDHGRALLANGEVIYK